MALPKLMYPTFELTIPSTKQKVRFRPFLVKEEKLLLMSKQSGENSDIINIIKQLIINCDVESSLDVSKLASFDLEYLFINLRARSINNLIELNIKDADDGLDYDVKIDIDEIKIIETSGHSKVIKLNENSGITMGYPSTELLQKIVKEKNIGDILFTMIKGCMETYYDGDKIVNISEEPEKELNEFIESLPTNVLQQFENFFDTMPRLYHKVQYTNSIGKVKDIELKTLDDFFMLG